MTMIIVCKISKLYYVSTLMCPLLMEKHLYYSDWPILALLSTSFMCEQ